MAIYSFKNNSLSKVDTTTFSNEKILERSHLQAALKTKIHVVAPECLVISEEFSEWADSQRRIDLLAIDKNGNLVVIELKRTETGEQMELQALRYAAMVSTLTFKRAVEIYQKYLNLNNIQLDAESSLLEFLAWDEIYEESFALDVRIILVSSDFSKELTTSVMWLNEKDLDIRCVRLIPHKYQGEILIDVQQIIPLPEAEGYQIKIKQQSEERRDSRISSKDYSRYIFKGVDYNKRKLVLAVIHDWINEHKPKSLSELLIAFPQDIRSGGVFDTLTDAKNVYEKWKIPRHFLLDSEVIRFQNSSDYAISNQWGKGNIENFVDHATRLGYEIKETS